jgi:hypothetical protein
MEQEKEVKNEWKEIILRYFHQKIPVRLQFKYPGFDRPTLRSGKILRVGDYSFTLDDVKEGEEHYSYEYVVEVKQLRV